MDTHPHTDSLPDLRDRIEELEHDLVAVVTLLSQQLGQPFAAQAQKIVTEKQTRWGQEG